MKTPDRFTIKTFGCKANTHDSGVLEADLAQQGWVHARAACDAGVVIVNSCGVTDEAERTSFRYARRALRDGKRVVLTGCAVEHRPDVARRAVPGATVIRKSWGKSHESLGTLLNDDEDDAVWVPASDREIRHWPPVRAVGLVNGRTRAFLKIQEGCDAFCTYCMIPYGRGPSRSLPLDDAFSQIQKLQALGVQEVVLTGTALGFFGAEQGPKGHALETLLDRIARSQKPIDRIRLTSLDPSEITPGILRHLAASDVLCPHIHLSVQSMNDVILRRMKRTYRTEVTTATLRAIYQMQPEAFVGMDLITGFPGETEEMHRETVKLLGDLPWTRLHVFPYSERSGTPATRLKDAVPVAVRKQRSMELNQLSLTRFESTLRARLTQHGGGLERAVLFENPDQDGVVSGYSRFYERFRVRAGTEHEKISGTVRTARAVRLGVDPTSFDVFYESTLV